MASINHNLQSVCNHLQGAVQAILNDDFIGNFKCQLSAQFSSDTIALVIAAPDGRKFMHPTFLTRHDIENRAVDTDLMRWRISSALRGQPARYPNEIRQTSFTLEEINAAQDEIDAAT